MVTRDTNWPEGTPCWVDLAADDFDKSAAFYSTLFGWTVQRGPVEFGGYAVATRAGRAVAGLMPKMDPAQPSAWVVYLAADDIDATLAKVVGAGGRAVSEPMDVGDLGRMALFTDPEGAFVGLWQGASHTGFQLANEPGSVTWNEVYARDLKRSRAFYSEVFGYTYDDLPMDDMEYATISVDGNVVGGIGELGVAMPEGAPQWTVCFKVEDTDAMLATVQQLGGRVLDEAADSEYGRIAQAADEHGAAFWLMGDNKG
jgi:predicted enzyme related to lactoylglutathione lyase